MRENKYLFIILCFFIGYIYISILKNNNMEDKDFLNIKILELDICGWNLLHVIFNFLVCYFFNVKTIFGFVIIFLLGILWFFFEKELFQKYNKDYIEKENKDTVYSSISYPRHDDIIYNLLGIITYIVFKRFKH
jgi:hypothetical protein